MRKHANAEENRAAELTPPLRPGWRNGDASAFGRRRAKRLCGGATIFSITIKSDFHTTKRHAQREISAVQVDR
jgi:hypothetical protein